MIPAEYLNQIVTGDARELSNALPDESVDLIFTDPVYSDRPLYDWLGKEARRILKPAGAVLCWSNGKWHRQNANWLEAAGLTYRYDFGNVMVGGGAPMCGKIIAKTNRVIWLDIDGQSKMRGYLTDGLMTVHGMDGGTSWGAWGKSLHFSKSALEAFAPPNALVLDPFCGGGTVPVVVYQSGRSYIGFELEETRAAHARHRVSSTQAIDPIFLEQQDVLI